MSVTETINHLNTKDTPLIVTHCPAVRLFLAKKQPQLIDFLNRAQSQLEMFLQQPGKRAAIEQCQDRKLEAYRFKGACFTALDMFQIIQELKIDFTIVDQLANVQQTSNYTFVQQLEKVLNTSFANEKGLNKDQTIYKFEYNGKEYKLVHSRSIRNLENLVRKKIKNNNELYFLEACPRGCFGGSNLASTQSQLQETSMAIHDEALKSDSTFEYKYTELVSTLVEVDHLKSPEEIAKAKGFEAGVKVTDMEW